MAHEIDEIVGRRVRTMRHSNGLTQLDLGNAIGVKFQQIQKYESGKNRISCSRIVLIAEALSVPVSDFFADLTSGQTTYKLVRKSVDGLIKLSPNKEQIAILAALDKMDKVKKQAFVALLFEAVKDTI